MSTWRPPLADAPQLDTFSRSRGRPLADALHVELKVLPGGHFLPLDNPDGLAQTLIEIIECLPTTSLR